MLPAEDVHGDWAASGEIDIVESTGNDPTSFSSTIHYGGVAPDNKFETSGVQSLVNDNDVPIDLSARFHLYRLDWTPERLQTFFDGHKVLDIDLKRRFDDIYKKDGAPFDEEFFLVMNMAVGGEIFGSDAKLLNTTAAEAWPRPMLEVDYVRVFEKIPEPLNRTDVDTGDRIESSLSAVAAIGS
jgi:beta-glucanase (GH16 family)